MSCHARVLLFSRDRVLLQTRQLVLGAFFDVHAAGRAQEVEKLLRSYRYDLLVLCYTLSDADRAWLSSALQAQKYQPKVLSLISAQSKLFPSPGDRTHMREAGPFYLLKRTAEIVGVEIKTKGRFIAA